MTITATAVPALWRLARIEFDQVRQQRVLLYPEGVVLLNDTGAAILELCDGSHNRGDLVAEVVRRSSERSRETEIIEFIDAARARGWIDEA